MIGYEFATLSEKIATEYPELLDFAKYIINEEDNENEKEK